MFPFDSTADFLKNNETIESIRIDADYASSCRNILLPLKNNKILRSLIVCDHYFEAENVSDLGRFFKTNRTLSTLSLENIHFNSLEFTELMEALSENSTITNLRLGRNICQNDGFIAGIQQNTSITDLGLFSMSKVAKRFLEKNIQIRNLSMKRFKKIQEVRVYDVNFLFN
eukprot:gene2102-1969_t